MKLAVMGRPIRHGQSTRQGRTPEYRIWRAMRQRCSNPNNKDYARYGGRNIGLDDPRWSKFVNFFTDMGRRPTLFHTLERIDNDKGYSKGNCRWATPDEQARNRGGLRSNRMVTLNGKTMCITDAVILTGTPYNTIRNRLNRGLSDEEACFAVRYRCAHA